MKNFDELGLRQNLTYVLYKRKKERRMSDEIRGESDKKQIRLIGVSKTIG